MFIKLTRQEILSGTAIIILLPVLAFSGVAIWAASNYTGTCPGFDMFDIPPHPCTIWEYIQIYTIAPITYAFNSGICIICGGSVLFLIFMLLWLNRYI
jgi:hypothetical protein